MTEHEQTICLCMIVKNERHVLRRCLEAVRGLVDTWVVVDTGSTDGTQQLVRECMASLPGALYERPWKNFGHNRTEALNLARGGADYILMVDADEYIAPEPGFRWPRLEADAYHLLARNGAVDWYRTQLVRAALPWRYEGVLHE